jgi:hypothetical protein
LIHFTQYLSTSAHHIVVLLPRHDKTHHHHHTKDTSTTTNTQIRTRRYLCYLNTSHSLQISSKSIVHRPKMTMIMLPVTKFRIGRSASALSLHRPLPSFSSSHRNEDLCCIDCPLPFNGRLGKCLSYAVSAANETCSNAHGLAVRPQDRRT